MTKNILIKVSGDLSENEDFLDFAKEKAKNNLIVVICGAGTKIGKALEEAGYETEFDSHGRITKTFEEKQIARDVLEEEQRRLQDKLAGAGINVVPPIIEVSSVLCHINGDNYVKALYLGFDEIYVFTLKERTEKKKKVFNDYSKVFIMSL